MAFEPVRLLRNRNDHPTHEVMARASGAA